MIGRFAHIGVYKELTESYKVYRIILAGLLALASYLLDRGNHSASTTGIVIATLSLMLNGLPIVWGALKGLIRRKNNVDELVSIAIIASIIEGEILTAAFVSFVMVLGSLIEEMTSESARKTIKSLIGLSPDTATVITGNERKEMPLSQIKPKDIILVKPGERIAVDGIVKKGITSVDESSITGEPVPVEKSCGNSLYAGTLNQNGVIEIEVTKTGEDSTLGKVIKLITDAENHKPQVIRVIDSYASWFTPVILFCAGLTWLLTGQVKQAVTVLIVGCPCALILAAPTAMVAAIGRAARSGILIRGGNYLEEVGRADVILFDKTGTITEGKPEVNGIISVEGMDKKDLLCRAASVELNSSHPFARAILKAADYAKITLLHTEE
ncbi:MAG: HAD-IC family P-type ATPase, partial [Candidatus Eremiobacterota bacterium]